MPKVWNRRDPNCPKDAIYVGRPTKWGNIFTHLKLPHSSGTIRVSSREIAIRNFRQLLDMRGHAGRMQIKHELKGKDLVCWCAPKPCHADVLLEIANG